MKSFLLLIVLVSIVSIVDCALPRSLKSGSVDAIYPLEAFAMKGYRQRPGHAKRTLGEADSLIGSHALEISFMMDNVSHRYHLERMDELYDNEAVITVSGEDGKILESKKPLRKAYGLELPGRAGWVRGTLGDDGKSIELMIKGSREEDCLVISSPKHPDLQLSDDDQRKLSNENVNQVGYWISNVNDYRKEDQRKLASLIPKSYWPSLYRGPYEKMHSYCPSTTRQIACGLAADYGYSLAISGGSTINKATVESSLVQLINIVNVLYTDQMNVYVKLGEIYICTGKGGPAWNEAPVNPSRNTGSYLSSYGCPSAGYNSNPQYSTLQTLGKWRASYSSRAGFWHLVTNCFPPPGTIGIAWVGVTCQYDSMGVGLSSYRRGLTWITVAHEIGHNFGAQHTFGYGGIMSYDNNPEYKFTSTNPAEVCQHIYNVLSSSRNCYSIYSKGSKYVTAEESICMNDNKCCQNGKLIHGAECSNDDNECCDTNCLNEPATKRCNSGKGYCASGVCISDTICPIVNEKSSFCYEKSDPCVQYCQVGGVCKSGTKITGVPSLAYLPDGVVCERTPAGYIQSRCFSGKCIPVDTTQKVFDIKTPSPSDIWVISEGFTLIWVAPINVANVAIDLYKNGIYELTIEKSVRNTGSHYWNIPDTLKPSNKYHIRISDAEDVSFFHESAKFKITQKPTISIIQPSLNDMISRGDELSLLWSSTGEVHQLRIYFLKGASIVLPLLVDNLQNTGEYTFKVSRSLPPGKDYRILIRDINNRYVYTVSEPFMIMEQEHVEFITPTFRSTYAHGQTVTIAWKSNVKQASDSYELHLSKNHEKVELISSMIAGNSITWTVSSSLEAGSNYEFEIRSKSTDEIVAHSTSFRIVKSLPSSITMLTPIHSDNYNKDETVLIKWQSIGVQKVNIELFRKNKMIKKIAGPINDANEYKWKVDKATSPGDENMIRVSSVSDNDVFGFSQTFNIVAPGKIQIISPEKETWKHKSSYLIRWITNKPLTNLAIYLHKGKKRVDTIATMPEDPGFVSYSVDTNLDEGSDYKIVFESNELHEESQAFRIVAAPSIQLTNAISKEITKGKSSAKLQWETNGIIPRVDVILIGFYEGKPFFIKEIERNVPNKGKYTAKFSVDTPNGKNFKIRVQDSNDNSIHSDSNDFTMLMSSTLILRTPDSDQYMVMGEDLDIKWDQYDLSPDEILEVQLLDYDKVIQTLCSDCKVSTKKFKWKVSTPKEGLRYSIRVSVKRNPLIGDESPKFAIYDRAYVKIVNPQEDSIIEKGDIIQLKWESNYFQFDAKISMIDQNGDLFQGTEPITIPNYGQYDIPIPYWRGSEQIAFKIECSGARTASATTNFFQIEEPSHPSPPSVISPGPDDMFSICDTKRIVWTPTEAEYVNLDLLYYAKGVHAIGRNIKNTGSYNWFIPCQGIKPSAMNKVIIEEVAHLSPGSKSDKKFESYFFSITEAQPKIQVEFLFQGQDGNKWTKGKKAIINWVSTSVEFVNIYLDYHDEMQVVIAKQVDASRGEYVYDVPTSSPPMFSPGYRVRIESSNSDKIYAVSRTFMIGYDMFENEPTVPTITVINPSEGSTFMKGEELKIRWSSEGRIDFVNIELFVNGMWKMLLADHIENVASFTWIPDFSLENSDGYSIKISSINGEFHGSSELFKIKKPDSVESLKFVEPKMNDVWIKGETYSVMWVSASQVKLISFDLVPHDGSKKWKLHIGSSMDSVGKLSIKLPEDNNIVNGPCKIEAKMAVGVNELIKHSNIIEIEEKQSVSILEPKEGDTLYKGGYSTLRWKATGAPFPIDIYLGTGKTRTTLGGAPCKPYKKNGKTIDECLPFLDFGVKYCAEEVNDEQEISKWGICAPLEETFMQTMTIEPLKQKSSTESKFSFKLSADIGSLPPVGDSYYLIITSQDNSEILSTVGPLKISTSTVLYDFQFKQAPSPQLIKSLKSDIAKFLGVDQKNLEIRPSYSGHPKEYQLEIMSPPSTAQWKSADEIGKEFERLIKKNDLKGSDSFIQTSGKFIKNNQDQIKAVPPEKVAASDTTKTVLLGGVLSVVGVFAIVGGVFAVRNRNYAEGKVHESPAVEDSPLPTLEHDKDWKYYRATDGQKYYIHKRTKAIALSKPKKDINDFQEATANKDERYYVNTKTGEVHWESKQIDPLTAQMRNR